MAPEAKRSESERCASSTSRNSLSCSRTIAAERGKIPNLKECALTDTFPLHMHHLGEFRVTEPGLDTRSDRVVTVRSDADGFSLLLDCSLRYFSAANDAGELMLHSGNNAFFTHGLPQCSKRSSCCCTAAAARSSARRSISRSSPRRDSCTGRFDFGALGRGSQGALGLHRPRPGYCLGRAVS